MAQLRDIISGVSALAGFEAAEIDASAIPDTDVRGYIVDRPQSAREVLEVLRALYRFDAQDTARLHFVGRGRDAGTAPGLTEDMDTLSSPQRVRAQETELPRIVTLSYLDAERQLEFGSATAQRSLVHRGLGAVSSRQRFDLRAYIVLTGGQARGMAERLLYAYWRERDRLTLTLPPRYLAISPGDFVSFLDRRNRRMLGRVERQDIGADLTTELEVTVVDAVTEPPSPEAVTRLARDVRTQETIPIIDAPQPTPLIAPGRRTDIDGRLRMVSVSALADADVDIYGRTVRPYATLERYEEAEWDNASIRVSQTRTGSQRVVAEGALASSIVGRLVTPPSDDWTPDRIDADGRLTVRVIDETARIRLLALRPTNEQEFVSDRSRIIIIRTDGEAAVLAYRFIEVSADDARVLVLSRLLRGQRGTEHLDRDYAGGETVVFLIPGERPSWVALNKAFRNRQLFFQAHLERTPLGVIPHRLIPAALRPYSPAHLTAEVASGDVTSTWVRRTRMGGEDDLLDGIEDVPNVEPVERYNVDVLAADGTEIHQALDVRATEYLYPAAQRATDETGLEVEYAYTIGLDEDGQGGRQDLAQTVLSRSLYSGNIVTMRRAGELLGVDWWASSGTERDVSHAVYRMDASTLLDVDAVLAEPSDSVEFDGRTGANFVSHDYPEPVPFAAGDSLLVGVRGGINVVPAGAERSPRLRTPFGFSVVLDRDDDQAVATSLGRGLLSWRLRYRMAIAPSDARTVRVAQVGWAGPGTPAEVTFTPEPLREPSRLRIAARLARADVFGFARGTTLRLGIRLEREEHGDTKRTREGVPYRARVLSGLKRAVRMQVAVQTRVFRRENFNVIRPEPRTVPPWRVYSRFVLGAGSSFVTYVRLPWALSGIVEQRGTVRAAMRLSPDLDVIGVGNSSPLRIWPRLLPIRDRFEWCGTIEFSQAFSQGALEGFFVSGEDPLPLYWMRERARAWLHTLRLFPDNEDTIYTSRSESYQRIQDVAQMVMRVAPVPDDDSFSRATQVHFRPDIAEHLRFELDDGTRLYRWEWPANVGLLTPAQVATQYDVFDEPRIINEQPSTWEVVPTGYDEFVRAAVPRTAVLCIRGPRIPWVRTGVRLRRPAHHRALQIAVRLRQPRVHSSGRLRMAVRFANPNALGRTSASRMRTAVRLSTPTVFVPTIERVYNRWVVARGTDAEEIDLNFTLRTGMEIILPTHWVQSGAANIYVDDVALRIEATNARRRTVSTDISYLGTYVSGSRAEAFVFIDLDRLNRPVLQVENHEFATAVLDSLRFEITATRGRNVQTLRFGQPSNELMYREVLAGGGTIVRSDDRRPGRWRISEANAAAALAMANAHRNNSVYTLTINGAIS